MNRKHRTACPRCGWHDTVPIVHGQPRPDLARLPERSRPALLRWLRGMDNPDRVCKKCGHQWAVGARP